MDKYIFKKSGALPLDECKYFIDLLENCDTLVFDKFRSYLAPNELSFNPKTYQEYFSKSYDYIKPSLEEYISLHPFLNNIGSPWDIDSMINLQKYPIGQHYKREHCEHGVMPNMRLRILAWMVYLNDIEKGGGTCWPQQNFISIPKAGDLYIWPAEWTHSHYGQIAPYEEKYILTGWCKFTDQPKP